MSALKGSDIEAFIKRPDPRYRVILVYGPDSGLVSERTRAITRITVDSPDDPFQLVKMDGDDIASDPLRLSDEANTIGMFGGRRTIWVRAGSKNLAPALEPLITTPPIDAVVIIEAGELLPKSPLRSMVEAAKTAVAIPCYADEERDIPGIIDKALSIHRLRITNDARDLLASLLGADRLSSRAEIEKVALYCHGRGMVELDDIEAVMSDTGAINMDALVDAIFTGDAATLDTMLRRCLSEGMDAGVLVGSALRHAITLQKARTAMDSGADYGSAEMAARLHFKRKAAFKKQTGLWGAQALDSALSVLAEAQAATRRSSSLGESIASRAFLTIALASRRGRS